MAYTVDELLEDVVADLTLELQNETDFDADALSVKVKGAILDVRQHRNYTASKMKEEDIQNDLYVNYYNIVLNVARYDYNQIGGEGEKSHTENGVTRNYVDRESLFNAVCPFVGVLV